jgi:seryl-tRNA synthetase
VKRKLDRLRNKRRQKKIKIERKFIQNKIKRLTKKVKKLKKKIKDLKENQKDLFEQLSRYEEIKYLEHDFEDEKCENDNVQVENHQT